MVLFKSDSSSIKETIEDAIRKGISLNEADLRGADLTYADLRGADLSGANLKDAYLNGTILNGADLRGADLSGAKFNCADLMGANLNNVNLSGADLRGANLNKINLRGADLSGASLHNVSLSEALLHGADLSGAVLMDANLNGSILHNANLNGAILHRADLMRADLMGAKNVPYIPLACPSEGSFIGWKKIYYSSIDYLVKLRIPEDALRCSATTSKCRCNKAEVLAIESLSTGYKDIKRVVNCAYGHTCTYTVGEIVYPDSFDENRWNECSHGIHFFINKQDAIDY